LIIGVTVGEMKPLISIVSTLLLAVCRSIILLLSDACATSLFMTNRPTLSSGFYWCICKQFKSFSTTNV